MSNLEPYKDIKNIASIASLAAVATTSVYFQNKISSMEDDINEVKNNLAAVIPYIDKDSNKTNAIINAVKKLDERVNSLQSNVQYVKHIKKTEPTSKKKYIRVTDRKSNKEPEIKTKQKEPESDTSDSESELSDSEIDDMDDIEDDIHTMTSGD